MGFANDGKRQGRRDKRAVKKDGKRKLRHHLKEDLRKNPEDAHIDDGSFKLGSSASKYLNGMDEAEYRRRKKLKREGFEIQGSPESDDSEDEEEEEQAG